MFGFNLADVLASFADAVCDLDLVEIFSGKESIATAAKQKGLASAGFDKARVLGVTDAAFGACSEDICSKAGFQHAVRLVGRSLGPKSSTIFWYYSPYLMAEHAHMELLCHLCSASSPACTA